MSNLPKIDRLLKKQPGASHKPEMEGLLNYAGYVAEIENVVAVVSDLKKGVSRIFPGKFGEFLGIGNYVKEDSIWEKAILDLMSENEREEKYLAELRFFNFLRHTPRHKRPDYYLVSKLRMTAANGDMISVVHRMYYIYADDRDTIVCALCLYGRDVFDFAGRSVVVNSLTGVCESLTAASDALILSRREQQVLRLIDLGKSSADIAGMLSISKNTVSRHRQEIISRLRVKNSVEACCVAKAMKII